MSGGNVENAFNMLLKLHHRVVTIERLGSSELVSGIVPATSVDLTSDISEGLAYVEGLRVVIPATEVTYTAEKDTYVDISSMGIITYTEVGNGSPAPSITANNLRVAKVVTSDEAITSVTMLRTPKALYGISPTTIRVTPSNYSRNAAGPEETTISGREYVISKQNLDSVYFPSPKKGDRIKDTELGTDTIHEVSEMFGFGGGIMGWKVKVN